MTTGTNVLISDSLKAFYKILHLDRKDISMIYVFAIIGGLVQLSLPLGGKFTNIVPPIPFELDPL